MKTNKINKSKNSEGLEKLSCRACGLEGSIRWDKKEIVIKDKNRSYKDLSFNFCKECGDVTNYMMLRGDRQ
jgi:hypothetical protein